MTRTAIYKLLDSGLVAGNRIGRNWIISEASLHAWINRTVAPPTSKAASRAFPEVEDRFS